MIKHLKDYLHHTHLLDSRTFRVLFSSNFHSIQVLALPFYQPPIYMYFLPKSSNYISYKRCFDHSLLLLSPSLFLINLSVESERKNQKIGRESFGGKTNGAALRGKNGHGGGGGGGLFRMLKNRAK